MGEIAINVRWVFDIIILISSLKIRNKLYVLLYDILAFCNIYICYHKLDSINGFGIRLITKSDLNVHIFRTQKR